MKFKIFNLSNLFIFLTMAVLWWVTAMKIEPLLHYHFQQTGFLSTVDFFKSYAIYPGGISDYLAEFIAQFFAFNLLGSLLIVAIAALQGLIVIDLIDRMAGKSNARFLIFALVELVAVMLLCDYRYPYYVSIRLLMAFVFTWAFYFVYKKFPRYFFLYWPLFAFLLFYMANGPALFVFTLSTAIMVVYIEKTKVWIKEIPGLMIFAGLLPFLAYKLIFPQTLINVYGITTVKPPELLAYSTFYLLYVYYALLPIIMLVSLFLIKKQKIRKEPTNKKVKTNLRFYSKPAFILTIQVMIVTTLGYFLFFQTHEPFKKKILSIEYYAETEQWDKILKVAEEIGIYDFRVNFQINRAYAHLGQLPQKMFSYPQLLGINGLFYDNSNMNGSFTMPNSDLYFDLGFMSESQHWAFEAQTLMPNSPRILKRLIMINLINRKYQLAEQFLTVLDQNMLCHDWVSKYQKYVADTTLTQTDPLIQEKRRFNPHAEYVHVESLEDLKFLFQTNPANRFAYNYLVAHCILSSNFSDLIKYLPYYTSFNIKTLPSSWEETLAIYIVRNKSIPDFVTEETVSKSCIERLSAFNKVVAQFNGDLPAAKNTLRSGFEDSYWYYMLYLDPKVTNVLKTKVAVQ